MNKKKIFYILASVFIVLLIIVFIPWRLPMERSFVFDKNSRIKIKDINLAMSNVDFTDENARDLFSKDLINPYTVKYFKFLEEKFKDLEFDNHLVAVHDYLVSIMPAEEAEKLFAIYKKFLEYEKTMAEKLARWGSPESGDEAIDMLHKVQEYRREFFGDEIADALFGAEIKSKEYPIRRSMIINDDSLYGDEKIKRIQKLNQDMWGDEADAVEEVPQSYTRYKEQLDIYNKDMKEMGESGRNQKVREIREKLFSSDVVQRLEEVDRQLKSEKETESEYFRAEMKVHNDPNLTREQKAEKIKSLQDETFGEEAEAFRRKENIRKGVDELK